MRKFVGTRRGIIGLAAVLLLAFVLTGCQTTGEQASTNETKKVYKVGVTQIEDHPSLDNCRKGFIQGLANEGFVEGENLEIDFQSAQGDMAVAKQIAQNFANGKKDLVCGIATPSAQSLYAECYNKNIPVIFNAVSDPVEAKLAKSETESMAGVSGISDRLPVEDQLKLIREILPDAKTIGILYTTSEANSISTLRTYKELAPKYGFEIVDRGVGKEAELPQALDYILTKVDCISNMTDNTVVGALALELEKANAKKIPVFGSEEEQVKNGCLASAGLDYVTLGIQAGEMAAKVLKGTDIATIPFETLKESKITVNQQAAEQLGITIPAAVLDKADTI